MDENNRLKYLIEFNGKQHYNYTNQFSMTEDEFKEGLVRDQLKIDYCIKNNIPLFIIKYDDNIFEKMAEIKEVMYINLPSVRY